MLHLLYTMPLGDIGTLIDNVGAWFQARIGLTTIRVLGVCATVYGFWMVFRAATSRTGQGGPRWLQAGVALIIGFGMLAAQSFYGKVGSQTDQSVQHAVTRNGVGQSKATDTPDEGTAGSTTIMLGQQLAESGRTVKLE